jgi:hypothetical protein
MKIIAFATCIFALLTASALPASETNLDGKWQGQGSSKSDECTDFDFWVSVKGNQVHGKAHQAGTDYQVQGVLSDKGQFRGTVSYLLLDIAELSGDIGTKHGTGQWKAVKGPDCEGNFIVRKLG